MAAVVVLIPDQMSPIMALPYTPLPVTEPGLATPFSHRQGAGKVALDQPSTQGKVAVAFGQGEDAVEMVG